MTQQGWPPPSPTRHAAQQQAWPPPSPAGSWTGPWQAQFGQPSWQAPAPRKSASGLLVGFLLVAGIALLGIAGYLVLQERQATPPIAGPTPQPSAPTASATPTGEEEPSPTPTPEATVPGVNPGLPARQWPALPPPNSEDPAWITLQQSVLYTAPMATLTGCPAPETAITMRQLETQVRPQMDCIQAAWRPVLASLGLPDHEIPIYFYSGSVAETPCGSYQAPALYCSANGGAIYFGQDILNGASFHPFGVKDVVGHEYGHHMQAQAGMFQASYLTETGDEASRRLELQATCWGYAMLAHDSSVVIDSSVFATFEPYLRLTIEDGIHGSHDSLAYWGIRGLYSTDLGNCNTWTAASEDVD